MKKNKRTITYKGCRQESAKGTARLELESGLARPKLNGFDYFIAALVAIIGAIWTYPYIGTAIEWDDVFYMNLSQYTTPQAWVLNRYGHIYLQKFFFWLTGNAFSGTRVYWCARLLAGQEGQLIGITAVSFFCIQPLFAKFAGCGYSDFTVMFLVTLGSFLYLAFLPGGTKHRRYVLVLVGLIFFWGLKSKEPGLFSLHICMGFLAGGFGFIALSCYITALLAGMIHRLRVLQDEQLFLLRKRESNSWRS